MLIETIKRTTPAYVLHLQDFSSRNAESTWSIIYKRRQLNEMKILGYVKFIKIFIKI